jgi:hypothetical protein
MQCKNISLQIQFLYRKGCFIQGRNAIFTHKSNMHKYLAGISAHPLTMPPLHPAIIINLLLAFNFPGKNQVAANFTASPPRNLSEGWLISALFVYSPFLLFIIRLVKTRTLAEAV